jgi:hypothetical protein
MMFENEVLRKVSGPKRDEVTGEWRKLLKEELYALYSPDIFPVIKSTRMRESGSVACIGERRGQMHTRFWWGNLCE